MHAHDEIDPILSPDEAVEYLGRRLSKQTLARRRVDGTGCPYLKIGSRIGYRRSALEAWLRDCERRSSSDGRTPSARQRT